MAQRAARLRALLSPAKRTADQAQRSFLKAEDVLGYLEQRERQRTARETRPAGAEADLRQRVPGIDPERRGR